MAVLDSLPGIEVFVRIEGEPGELQEYDDDEEEVPRPGNVGESRAAKTVSKYIESASEKFYSVELRVKPSYVFDSECLIMQISIDGKRMHCPVMTERTHHRAANHLLKTGTMTSNGPTIPLPGKNNQQYIRKYKFSKIETTTDEAKVKDIKNDTKSISNAGEIQIEIFRGGTAKKIESSYIDRNLLAEKSASVHEKALKGQAKSHTTLLGPLTDIGPSNKVDVKCLDGEDNPIGIWRFLYRDRAALKSLLILPRTPSPEPDPDRASANPLDIVENLNVEQKKKLERFIQDLTGSDNPNRAIKRERDSSGNGESSRKKRRPGQKIFIDLTDD